MEGQYSMSATTPSKPYENHLLRPGNTNCAGCGMSVGLQWLDEALGDEQPVLVIPSCCGIVTAGAFPTSGYGVPTAATTFASSPAVATGIAAVTGMNDIDNPVICWAGDGGTYDIGLATLSAAAERNEDIIYICYDNEIYGNTGGQRSSATPVGSVTTTTPTGKAEGKKDIMAIMAAHRVPYAATLSEPDQTTELVEIAVRSGLFPLYEIFDGVRYRINQQPDNTAVESYTSQQRRFRELWGNTEKLQSYIDAQWRYLDGMAKAFPAKEELASG
jgi:pyruvate ferredoxin oxidoreductase beta subunit/2-oxoisovalerate ferredoxin oxidoreductase beta subunit